MARSSPIGRPELACIRPPPPSLERFAHTIVPPSYRTGHENTDGTAGPVLRWVPKRVVVGIDALGLDHLSAFVLLHVDGLSDIGQIAYSSGIPVLEVVAMLEQLRRKGAVRFEDRSVGAPGSVCPPATVSEVRVIAAEPSADSEDDAIVKRRAR